jgi:small conductance mechanosensitive channel
MSDQGPRRRSRADTDKWEIVMDVKGWTMKGCRAFLGKLGLAVFMVTLSATTSVGLAQGDPNEAASEPMDLSIGTAQRVLDQIYGYLAQYGLKILGAILIFIVGRWIAKAVSNLAGKALSKAKMDETLVRFIKDLCYIALLTFVIIAALSKIGIQTASFIAVLGAAGLAVGLALQGSLANFASGVLMLIFKPMRVGDYVEAGGAAGSVAEIGIFTTVLNSPDNVRIIVPNSQVMGGNIKNYTVNGTRRVDLVIGVSYEDDLKKVRKVIEKVLAADERILPEPATVVAVSALADSSVNFVVRPWVKSGDYWPTYFDLTAKIKVALEENGLTIPFPQRDVHVKDGHLAGTAK